MSYAIDTSIWARSLQQNHPLQQPAKDAVKVLLLQSEVIYLLPQNLYELWVVATRPAGENLLLRHDNSLKIWNRCLD